MKMKILAYILVLVFGFVAYQGNTVEAAGEIPPWPLIYTGNVTVAGEPAADGLKIVGKIGDYTSIPLETAGGRLVGLAVGPPNYSYFGQTITFVLMRGEEEVVAEETDLFTNLLVPTLRKDFHLTFPGFPTPTPIPTATSTPAPTATATPVATATPIAVGTILYNGMVVASGGSVPDGALLTARIGAYTARGVPVENGQFISLIIDVDDVALTGGEVKFYLDGIEARTTAKYEVGPTVRNIDLIFMDLPMRPTSTAIPMPTVPPSPTAAPTVEVSAAIQAPTVTVATQVPVEVETPTPIVLVVTATPAPDEPVVPGPAEGSDSSGGGGCNAISEVGPATGAANVIAMVGPILLLVGFRGLRKFSR